MEHHDRHLIATVSHLLRALYSEMTVDVRELVLSLVEVAVDIAKNALFSIPHNQLVDIIVPSLTGLERGCLQRHIVQTLHDQVQAFDTTSQREVVAVVRFV